MCPGSAASLMAGIGVSPLKRGSILEPDGCTITRAIAPIHWAIAAREPMGDYGVVEFELPWRERMVQHPGVRGETLDCFELWCNAQDDVETKLYGLKKFSRHGSPQTLTEARERGIYTLINSIK